MSNEENFSTTVKTLDNLIISLLVSFVIIMMMFVDQFLINSPLVEVLGIFYPLAVFNVLVIAVIVGYFVYPSKKDIDVSMQYEKMHDVVDVEFTFKSNILSFVNLNMQLENSEYGYIDTFYLVDDSENIIDSWNIEPGSQGGSLKFQIMGEHEESLVIRGVDSEKNSLIEEITIDLEVSMENKDVLI